MSEGDRRRRTIGIRGVVKVFTIVTVTAALTSLCFRIGPSLSKTPNSAVIFNQVDYGERTIHDFGNLSVVATSPETAILNGTREPMDQKRDDERPTVSEDSTSTATEEQTPKNLKAVNHLQANTRSMNTGRVQNDNFEIGSSVSRSRVPPIALRGDLIHTNRYSTDRDHDDDDVIVDTGNFQRKMNNYNYANTETDKWSAEHDGSTGYHDMTYDSNYNTGDYGYNKQPDYQTALTVDADPAGLVPHHSNPYYWPQGGSSDAGSKRLNANNHQLPVQITTEYSPSHSVPEKIVIPVPMKIELNWRTIGIMALIKLGLVKLKAFGVINVLLFLLFKLIFILKAVFSKSLLVLKFAKLFAVSILPVLSTLLSPVISSAILSIPRRILEMLLRPTNAPASSVSSTLPGSSTALTGLPNNLPGILSPSRPGIPSTSRPTGSSIPTANNRKTTEPFDDQHVYFPFQNNHKMLTAFDHTLDAYRKLLDSEKCVERIACRMAVAEKTGIMPSWINWILHGVSQLISSENLQSYFKTYDGVAEEILSNSSINDSLATWCLERYYCNNTNVSNMTKTNLL